MMPQRRLSLALALAVCAMATSGCNKNKPKAEEQKSEAVPVPSGLVFNDFLPQSGEAKGLGVKGGGGDGGLGEATGAGGEPAAETADPNEKLSVKVIEPGAEPRTARKYAFVANKTDKRVITVSRTTTQAAEGRTSPPEEITTKVHLDLTPKQVKPTGATFEAKVTKVELPGAPPQVAPMLAAMNGLTMSFEVSSHGEAGEMSISAAGNSQALQGNPQLARQILDGLSQGIQLLFVPLPTAPIGVGAKWEMAAKGEEQRSQRFTLKESTKDADTVDVDINVKMPRRAEKAPNGQGTVFIEVDGRGHYTQELRPNQPATKADGELAINEKVEIPTPKGKQVIVQATKMKQTIAVPGMPAK